LVRREDDEAIIPFLRCSAYQGIVRRSLFCRRRSLRLELGLSWLYIDDEDAPKRRLSSRIANFCIQGKASRIDEAGAVERIASDFEEVAVMGQYPAVGCGGERMDGKDFKDISSLDLDGFIRFGPNSVIEELRCSDCRTEACESEGEYE